VGRVVDPKAFVFLDSLSEHARSAWEPPCSSCLRGETPKSRRVP